MPSPYSNGALNILDRHLSAIGKRDIDPAADAFLDYGSDAYSAGISQWFKTRGNIDAVAINVIPIDYDISKIDTDAQCNGTPARVVFANRGPLNCKRAVDRVDNAGKLNERTVAGELYEATFMLAYRGIEHCFSMAL
jgi:hypothetical protein